MATISFSGIASGIDSTSLIKSILDQKRKGSINPLKTRITNLEETNSSFGELHNLLATLQSAAGKFREINGGTLSKTLTSADETVISGSAANSATNGSYSVTVGQLAKNATHSFNDRFSSETQIINTNINNADPALDRTVTYTIGTGSEEETVDIELSNTTSASEFVTSFNEQSEKATASLVNVGTSASPSYAILINSNNPGTTKGSIAVNVGARVTDPNGDTFTTDGAFVSAATSAATDAEISVVGLTGTITRSSNTVSDVIPGVTLDLQALGTAKVTIGDDSASTTSDVQDFVDAYNAVVAYIKENNTVTREEDGSEVNNVFGPLARTSLDDSILSTLRSALSGAGTSGRTVNIFADLGITTQRDGSLAFDSDKFKEALTNDAEGVRLITQNLGEDLSAVDGKIAQFIRFNGLIDVEERSNTESISSANSRISTIEALLQKEESSLNARFSRLEALIGKLNSQQTALASSLG